MFNGVMIPTIGSKVTTHPCVHIGIVYQKLQHTRVFILVYIKHIHVFVLTLWHIQNDNIFMSSYWYSIPNITTYSCVYIGILKQKLQHKVVHISIIYQRCLQIGIPFQTLQHIRMFILDYDIRNVTTYPFVHNGIPYPSYMVIMCSYWHYMPKIKTFWPYDKPNVTTYSCVHIGIIYQKFENTYLFILVFQTTC